ncbi:MAG: peptidoglycan-binding protein, partial [Xanthomonadaceae bacterium]|nr:peptidoglycan-binding protein [Xanthomonadaceae bacterium]
MSNPLTADEAISLLRQHPKNYSTLEQLGILTEQVDANSSGRLTVLYSGETAKGIWSSDVINAFVEAGEDVRVINRSHVAQFLISDDFYEALANIYQLDDARELSSGRYRGPATDWLYHPTEGPWAKASARFADATVGEVHAIATEADPTRTFGAVELPRILNNPNVTTIEGIPREVLVSRQQ